MNGLNRYAVKVNNSAAASIHAPDYSTEHIVVAASAEDAITMVRLGLEEWECVAAVKALPPAVVINDPLFWTRAAEESLRQRCGDPVQALAEEVARRIKAESDAELEKVRQHWFDKVTGKKARTGGSWWRR